MTIKIDEVHKFGRNASVATAFEPIVDENAQGNFFPAAAAATTIVSTSAEDDTDKGGEVPGTGAFTVEILGINDAGSYVLQTATMNGTAAVTLGTPIRAVLRAKVLTAGTGGTNAGRIDIKHTSTIIGSIAIDAGQSEIAAWFVSNDQLGADLVGMDVGIESISTKTITVVIKLVRSGVTRELYHTICDSTRPSIENKFQVPISLLPGDLVYIAALGSTGTTAVHGRLYIKQF